VVVFGQGGLEIGGGDMVWASLVSTPLVEEAIAQAKHHSENQHGRWLVPLDRDQIIGAVFQDQGAGGFILGV
jgi:hypothetical protein